MFHSTNMPFEVGHWLPHETVLGLFCLFTTFPFFCFLLGLRGILISYCCIIIILLLLYAGQYFILYKGISKVQNVENKHIVITGGSRGIGESIAHECVRRKANIITIIARQLEDLERVQNECIRLAKESKLAVLIQTIQADMYDIHQTIQALKDATQLKGKIKLNDPSKKDFLDKKERPIDGLFCNAAYVDIRPLLSISIHDIETQVTTNLTSVIAQIHHVLPSMIKNNEGFICISNSLATFVPIYGLATYAATKAALRAFSLAIDQEVAGTKVLITNAYMPTVETPGLEKEKLMRHPITHQLEGVVKPESPSKVARLMLNGIEKRHRTITFNFEGWALARSNAGFSRAESLASIMYEFFCGGIIRAILLGLFLQFYNIIEREKPSKISSLCTKKGA